MSRNSPLLVHEKQRNRRIDSEDKLLNYIRSMLGEPLISVELTDDQIYIIIDDTIRKFSDFAYGGEQTISFIIEGREDIQDYKLDSRVQAIKSVSFGNSLGTTPSSAGSINLGSGWGTIGVGYIPHITMQGEVSSLVGNSNTYSTGSALNSVTDAYVTLTQRDHLQSLFARGVNFEFNSNTKILRVFEQVSGSFMIEASIEYSPNPEYDEVYSHPWIKEYALNACKFVWGSNVGKYSQNLIGGGSINYNDMKSEAKTEIDKLNEDLLNKYSEALGIFSL